MMDEHLVEALRTQMRHLLPRGFHEFQGQRALTASEVLFLESIQICVQERWIAFARHLLKSRIDDLSQALEEARSTQEKIGAPEAVLIQIDSAREHVVRIPTLLSGGAHGSIEKRDGRDAEKADIEEIRHSAGQAIEHLQHALAGLSEGIREEIDEVLCRRHRRHMVSGMDAEKAPFSKGIHAHATLGLAMSGGGIRSASFSIGVLQAMARKGLLPAFQYVSSVSGGGYAASWYLAWAYRHRDGTDGVSSELNSQEGGECGPLRWVRRHSSYLAPRLNLTVSSDAPALIVAYVFNWLPIFVLVCLALSTVLLVPHAVLWTSVALSNASMHVQSMSMWLGLAALVVLISVVRRLTMFRRAPAQPARYPAGLPPIVAVLPTILAIWLSVAAPSILNQLDGSAACRAAGILLSRLECLSIVWVLSCTAALVIAVAFATDRSQRIIDRFRFWLWDIPVPMRPKLRRLPVPLMLFITGLFVGAFAGARLTEVFLAGFSREDSKALLTAFGPLIAVMMLALSELGTAFIAHYYMLDIDRAWSARVGGWMVTGAAVWAGVAAISLFAMDGLLTWLALPVWPKAASIGAAILLGVAAWRRGWIMTLHGVIAVAFVAVLAATVASPLAASGTANPWVLTLITLFVTVVLGSLINVNRFSLHALYREGLVRTFLAASRLGSRNANVRAPAGVNDGEAPQFTSRRPDPITNIDDDDNPALAWMCSREDRVLPIFLLNAAVNGRSPSDVDGRVPRQWPYTFSQYFCGSPAAAIGYSRSEFIFRRGNRKPLTLGTAMAVSGAAMSPTAGRTTHPIRAFILGLLNARLGLWVGNPSSPSTVSQESPPLTGWAVLSEVLGIRAKFTSWIHLSDGGHFENLGVYELLRRGCSRIVVVDGSCDPKGYMADLANLIRRARIDLGIIVRNPEAADFGADLGSRWSDAGPLALDSDDRDGTAEGSWRWFTVDYGQDMPLGRLLYIKPSAVGRADLPIEVRQYWKRSPAFPHETTADQFFTEAQMEAYRSLGQADGERALQTVLQIKRARSPQVDRGLLNALLRQAVRSPASGGSA